MSEIFNKNHSYTSLISLIHKRNVKYKIEFLKSKIKPARPSTKDEIEDFILFIRPYLLGLYFSDDRAVQGKFKQLYLKNETLKWFISIDVLKMEIDRLKNNPDVKMNPKYVLTFCICYIEMKIMNRIEVELGYGGYYNKISDRTQSFINLDNVFRKREYNMKKGQSGKQNQIDSELNNLIDSAKGETVITNEKEAKFFFKDFAQAKGQSILSVIANCFTSNSLSKRRFYIELFPLLKIICKDNQMHSRVEHFSKKIGPDDNDKKSDKIYNDYMASRVKKY